MGNRINKIKKVILTKPYVYSLISIIILYLVVNIMINQVYETAPFLFDYNLKIIIPFIIFNLIIAILIGISINPISTGLQEVVENFRSSEPVRLLACCHFEIGRIRLVDHQIINKCLAM